MLSDARSTILCLLLIWHDKGYDAAGNITHIAYYHREDGVVRTLDYEYNNLNRLIHFEYNTTADVQSYTYDDNGNLLTLGSKTYTYASANNRLSNDGTRSYTYDNSGRVTAITGGVTIGYDIFNNMTSCTKTCGNYTFAYDAHNTRIRSKENSVNRYYITSGHQLLAEYATNDILEAEHIYANGQMIADYTPAEGYGWYLVDHLGSTRRYALSDEGESHMRVNYYYPHGDMPAGGRTVSGDDHAETPYQFSQKRLDNGIGLYYFGSRYYDPSIGRWYVPDPAGQAWSPYLYCANSPVNYIDPNGELFVLDDMLIAMAIGAVANSLMNAGDIHDFGDFVKYAGIGTKSFQYAYNNNQLSNDSTRSFSYDDAGRMTTRNGVILNYDIFSNMIGHGSDSYSYDDANQRIKKVETGQSTYYVTADAQVFAECASDGTIESEYIYANGRMLARFSPTDEYGWYYVDHLGSTRRFELADDGQSSLRQDYTPYGEFLGNRTISDDGTADTPYGFSPIPLT